MGYSRYPIRKHQLTLNYPGEKYTFRAVYQLERTLLFRLVSIYSLRNYRRT